HGRQRSDDHVVEIRTQPELHAKYAKISRMLGGIKEVAEYAMALLLIRLVGMMPRSMARPAAQTLAWLGFHLAMRQRKAGMRNLQIAFPELSDSQREHILRGSFQNIGRLLVEFTHFPELNKSNIPRFVVHDGLENYLEGVRRGRGVIFMTA